MPPPSGCSLSAASVVPFADLLSDELNSRKSGRAEVRICAKLPRVGKSIARSLKDKIGESVWFVICR